MPRQYVRRTAPGSKPYQTPEEKRAYHREMQRIHRAELYAKRPQKVEPPKPTHRVCVECHRSKPLDAETFYSSKQGKWGYQTQCKDCSRSKAIVYNYKRKYGLSMKEVDAMKSGVCVICGAKKKLVIDHCHRSGKIRNVLCNDCNSGLGMFHDNPERLRIAATYLEAH